MVGSLIMSGLSLVGKLGDKLIEDKDKKTEFAFKTQELTFKTMEVLLQTKTYPFVDALVKLMYAAKVFIRPIGSLAMAGFAAYCAVNNIELNEVIQTTLFGAPVAWGVSRHVEKKRKGGGEVSEDEDWLE